MSSNSEAPASRRLPEFLRIWGLAAVIAVLGFLIAWRFVGPPPPSHVRLATGPEGGGYALAGEHFHAELAEAGIEVELVSTQGSLENLELARSGEVDLALVQGGVAHAGGTDDAHVEGWEGIVSLYLEPLWLFSNDPVTRLDQLEDQPVQWGSSGSGTRILAQTVLEAAGVTCTAGTQDGGLKGPEALAELESGSASAVFQVAAPRSASVRALFESSAELQPANLERSGGLVRHLTYLQDVKLAAGAIDLERNWPAEDLKMVAAGANLVASEDLHSSIVALFVDASKKHYSGRGVLEAAGEFPSQELLDLPVNGQAGLVLAKGPSFLYRWLPFQVAAVIDRLKILLVPLITLLFPLVRAAPPLYRMRIRRRILRHYRDLLALEKRLRSEQPGSAEREAAAAELDELDGELAELDVPLSYADELFHLRSHVRLIREDLRGARGRWAVERPS